MSQEQVSPAEEAQKIWAELDAEDAGAPAPEVEADPVQPESAPAQEQQDAAPADKADAPPAIPDATTLMDKIAGLESLVQQQAQRLRNAEGHIGGLNNQLKQQQELAKRLNAAGGEAPTAKELREAQGSPKAMEDLKRDYPEFAEAMESALNARLSQVEQLLHQQQPAQPAVSPDEINRLRAEFQVEVRHPGWQNTVQTPEFRGWLTRQPREVQMLAASESPQDATRLLDIFSETAKAVTSTRNQRLNAAAAIPSGRASGVRQKAVEDMTPAEYWRYLDELDRSKGR